MKHFSGCIGECITCAFHGHCLAGINDDDYVTADKAELIGRLKNHTLSEHNQTEIKRVLKKEYGYDYDKEINNDKATTRKDDDDMNINDYISTSLPEVETLADYDAIVQYTNTSVKSDHSIISNLKTGDIINAITIRHGYIDGKMVIENYTDKEFNVYHSGLKIGLKFTPEMLPEITFHNGERERLFKCELVPSIHPKFKPDTLVQLIRDPEADFKYIEEDITGLCYIEGYVDSLEGFSMKQIQKTVTNIENRPCTLCIPTRFFSLVELNKYLFKVIDVDFGKIHD